VLLYSDLMNWTNGTISAIDRSGLIAIAAYFENGKKESDIEYDIETDEVYTGV